MKIVNIKFFYTSTNHSYTNHVKDDYIKNNNVFYYLVILLSNYFVIQLFCYPIILNVFNKYKYQRNMASINLNTLNFIHNFNSSNITIFNICGFHHCFFCEQNIILHHRIFPDPFCLTAQNNPVVIDLRYFYGSPSESNHKINQNKNFSSNIFENSPQIAFNKFCITYVFVKNSVNLFKMNCKRIKKFFKSKNCKQ